MIYIGIDTGVNTGVAVWDNRKRKFLMIRTMKIHEAVGIVQNYIDMQKCGVGDKVVVRVEDPRKRTWFGTERMSWETERKMLQGVGSVKRDAAIWEDYLADQNVEFEMVAPKDNVTKLKADAFKNITGWKERTSEHCRDAAMMVFGL